MSPFRVGGALAVALIVPGCGRQRPTPRTSRNSTGSRWWRPPTCAGTVSAEAQVTPVQVDERVEDGVRVAIHYDAGTYDGSCALTVTASWVNLHTGASGSGDITAVSTIDGHYGFFRLCQHHVRNGKRHGGRDAQYSPPRCRTAARGVRHRGPAGADQAGQVVHPRRVQRGVVPHDDAEDRAADNDFGEQG